MVMGSELCGQALTVMVMRSGFGSILEFWVRVSVGLEPLTIGRRLRFFSKIFLGLRKLTISKSPTYGL